MNEYKETLKKIIDHCDWGLAHLGRKDEHQSARFDFMQIQRLARELMEKSSPGRDVNAPELPLGLDPVARARNTDPSTSHAAAASITPEKIRDSQLKVLRCLHYMEQPLNDEAIYDQILRWWGYANVSVSGARTRRSELVGEGLVECKGYNKMKSGRMAKVWGLTKKGRGFIDQTWDRGSL